MVGVVQNARSSAKYPPDAKDTNRSQPSRRLDVDIDPSIARNHSCTLEQVIAMMHHLNYR